MSNVTQIDLEDHLARIDLKKDVERHRLNLIPFGEIEPIISAADFVEGLLTDGGMSVIYGPSNCGKTFVAMDLALSVAAGGDWHGREIEQGAVIYVAAEGSAGVKNRVTAWRSYHEADVKIPFFLCPHSLDLHDPDADTGDLITAINSIAEKAEIAPRLIVLDTLARIMANGEENSSKDMGTVVANVDRVRAETGAHVMLVHHSGKDEARGARGSSVLRAAVDTEIEVKRDHDDNVTSLVVRKQRDIEIGEALNFELLVVELGVNHRGKTVTSCVVLPTEKSAKPKRGRKAAMTDGGEKVLSVLLSIGDGNPIQINDLLDACRARDLFESRRTNEKVFRALSNLENLGRARIRNNSVILCDD